MNRIYNTISLIFTLLTLVVIAGVLVVFATTEPQNVVAVLPTLLPTFTPVTPTETLTPSETTLPPTYTHTATVTLTYTPSNTPTVTATPTATITDTPAPTLTPSLTFTPSISPTLTPSYTPTGPTPTPTLTEIPYPFKLRESPPRIVQNFANSAGCNWQGIGGQVLSFDGSDYRNSNLVVRAFKSSSEALDRTAKIGSNTLYGNTGWEIALETGITDDVYFVQLETINGSKISPTYQIKFPASCDQNVAVLNFIQTRPQP